MISSGEFPLSEPELDHVLRELIAAMGSMLHAYDQDATLFQFGSSSKFFESGADIDLMILSERLAEDRDFDRRLEGLRAGLLQGDPSGSFETGSEILKAEVVSLAQQFSTEKGGFIPSFSFGPLSGSAVPGAVVLHVNGPISGAQLHTFCRLLPLHARAIIHNARVIAGSFESWQYEQDTICDEKELRRWLLSLKARFRREGQSPRKLFRKLMLNIAMYRQRYEIADADLLSSVWDYLPLGLSVSVLDRMSSEKVGVLFEETLERALAGECGGI